MVDDALDETELLVSRQRADLLGQIVGSAAHDEQGYRNSLSGTRSMQRRGKGPHELLFGRHWRDWPRQWVQRICREAGVPEITAHGMRGLHSTLAVDSGITGHAVAAALGHESFEKTTAESYVQPGAIANAQQRQVLKVLAGGRNRAPQLPETGVQSFPNRFPTPAKPNQQSEKAN